MKNYFTKLVNSDVFKRATKTFVQAFLAVLVVGYVQVKDFQSAKALLVAALASAISATWNFTKNTL